MNFLDDGYVTQNKVKQFDDSFQATNEFALHLSGVKIRREEKRQMWKRVREEEKATN